MSRYDWSDAFKWTSLPYLNECILIVQNLNYPLYSPYTAKTDAIFKIIVLGEIH